MRQLIMEFDLPDDPDIQVFEMIDCKMGKKQDLFKVDGEGYIHHHMGGEIFASLYYQGELIIEAEPVCHFPLKYVLSFENGKITKIMLHPEHYLVSHYYRIEH